MSKSFRRSSYQRASDVTDDTHRAATEHALAEQIALATSWAVHIRAAGTALRQNPRGGQVLIATNSGMVSTHEQQREHHRRDVVVLACLPTLPPTFARDDLDHLHRARDVFVTCGLKRGS